MSETTPRFALPLLQAGQAQKEIDHNEALVLIDGGLHPLVQTAGDDTPPGSPSPGAAWIVGPAPTGGWSGAAHALALWTGGGWRFLPPTLGMTVWNAAAGALGRVGLARWRDRRRADPDRWRSGGRRAPACHRRSGRRGDDRRRSAGGDHRASCGAAKPRVDRLLTQT